MPEVKASCIEAECGLLVLTLWLLHNILGGFCSHTRTLQSSISIISWHTCLTHIHRNLFITVSWWQHISQRVSHLCAWQMDTGLKLESGALDSVLIISRVSYFDVDRVRLNSWLCAAWLESFDHLWVSPPKELPDHLWKERPLKVSSGLQQLLLTLRQTRRQVFHIFDIKVVLQRCISLCIF